MENVNSHGFIFLDLLTFMYKNLCSMINDLIYFNHLLLARIATLSINIEVRCLDYNDRI